MDNNLKHNIVLVETRTSSPFKSLLCCLLLKCVESASMSLCLVVSLFRFLLYLAASFLYVPFNNHVTK